MNPRTGSRPKTLRLRTPEDVLAAVPLVLGFRPADSIVLVTTTGRNGPFHARIDLPDDPVHLTPVAEHLARAALANDAASALVVVYTVDTLLAQQAGETLRSVLLGHGIDVPLALAADGARYVDLDDPDLTPYPYDLSGHPITAEAVFDGRVLRRSRQELVDSLVPTDPDAVERVHDLTVRARDRLLGHVRHPLGPFTPQALLTAVEREAEALAGLVAAAVREGEVLDDEQLARLLAVLTVCTARDRFWAAIRRPGADAQVRFWTDVVRRSHPDHVNRPAALLAFASWLSGNGALAWCAVDRCREAEPDNTIAELVARALTHAVHPDRWEEMAASLPSLRPAAAG